MGLSAAAAKSIHLGKSVITRCNCVSEIEMKNRKTQTNYIILINIVNGCLFGDIVMHI